MRFLRQGLFGLFLVSLTLGLLAYAAHVVVGAVQERMADEPRTPERDERVFAVRTVTADETQITPTLGAYGQIESRRTLEIRTQATGILTELAPEFVEGGSVRAGQFLARIDPADARAARDRALTDLTDARAERREAARALDLAREELQSRRDQAALQERALERQRDLADRGAGTTAAVETAELNAVQARQAVLTTRQAVASAEASAGIALGTIVGAAMVALALAFGVTALIVPLDFEQAPRRILVLPVGAVAVLTLLALDGRLSRGDGALLLLGYVAYVGTLIAMAV